jgi:hypothetical protein
MHAGKGVAETQRKGTEFYHPAHFGPRQAASRSLDPARSSILQSESTLRMVEE